MSYGPRLIGFRASAFRANRQTAYLIIALLAVTFLTVLTGCSSGSEFIGGDAHAIELARHVPGVSRIEKHPGNFGWYVVMYCRSQFGKGKCPRVSGSENPKLYPIRVVCYCDQDLARPRGWFIEANLLTNSARAISGNPTLQKVYDLP